MAEQEKRPGRILIVEDEGIVAADIAKCLEDHGFEVAGIAGSADDAIQEALLTCPDLVLMDIRIQGELDGVETAEVLHRRFGPAVVYLTAHGDKDTIERAKKTLPLGFLLKPFKESELITAIEFALEKARSERLERERNRAALQLSEERLRSLMAGMPAGFCVCDNSGEITFYNERAAELWGRSPSIGDPNERFTGAFKLYRADGAPLAHEASPMAEALSKGAALADQEVIFERPDGSRIHHLINAIPVRDERGTIAGVMNTRGAINTR